MVKKVRQSMLDCSSLSTGLADFGISFSAIGLVTVETERF